MLNGMTNAGPQSEPCDCARLMYPLPSGDALPTHVCESTMRGSISNWHTEFWETAQIIAATLVSERIQNSALLSAYSNVHKAVADFSAQATGIWPVWHCDRLLGLVIRQWAEEPGSETFARQLDTYGPWNRALSGVASQMVANPGAATDILRTLLRSDGLPWTPSVIGYALGRLGVHPSPPLPARGVLVVTYVYLPPRGLIDQIVSSGLDPQLQQYLEQNPIPDIDPNSTYEIQGDTEWTTEPLLAKYVLPTVLAHRDWVRAIARHDLTNVGAVRSAQRTAFRGHEHEPELDYLAEALASVDNLQANVRAGATREQAISRHIRSVSKRVANRRRAANMSTTPPPGWSAKAREQLRKLIAKSGA